MRVLLQSHIQSINYKRIIKFHFIVITNIKNFILENKR